MSQLYARVYHAATHGEHAPLVRLARALPAALYDYGVLPGDGGGGGGDGGDVPRATLDALFFVAVSYAVMLTFFWAHNALLYLFVYRCAAFDRYKIVPARWPPRALVVEALRGQVVQTLTTMPLGFALTYRFGFGGGAMAFGVDVLPSLATAAAQLVFYHLAFDAYFYWAHRAAHLPAFYAPIHKQHHRFATSIGIAATYAHPVEELLVNYGSTLVGPLLWPPHVAVWALYFAARMHETVDAHCGYVLPWSPWRMLPGHGGAARHDFHHSKNVGCYGAFTWWDRWAGTDRAFLAAQRANAAAKST